MKKVLGNISLLGVATGLIVFGSEPVILTGVALWFSAFRAEIK